MMDPLSEISLHDAQVRWLVRNFTQSLHYIEVKQFT